MKGTINGIKYKILLTNCKKHYAMGTDSSEERTLCHRYYSCDVDVSMYKEDVTCKHCLKRLEAQNV